ncbi:MAG: hypothetical protein HDR88_14795 [Bacteroides sp.]|nr:hypothetical protein [Bacteroides sp.]
MKKFLIFILLWVTAIGSGMAQNANRSGFFLEAGIGGLVGDNVRTSISTTDNVMSYKCLSGMAGDFGLGYRLRFKRHWAYEVKAEGTIPFQDPIHALIGRFLPIGFRYTSGELWRNYSLYTHFNLGGAISVNGGKIGHDNLSNETLYPNMSDNKIKGYRYKEGYGAAYSLGVGINITTHFYAEACWDGQVLFDCYGKNGRGTLNGGMVAFVIGYRF